MTSPDTAPVMKTLSIRVIGLGGAGVTLVGKFHAEAPDGVRCAVIHTNSRVLDHSPCAERVLLGAKLLRGLGAGGDPDLGRAVAEDSADQLKSLCSDTDLVLIVAGLGGGTATGVAPVLARIAKDAGALVLAVVAVPFDFEGQRQRQAQAGLRKLRGAADAVLCLHNQKVCQLWNEDTRALEIFNSANELWVQGVQGVLNILTRRGFIHVDFADLAAVLRGRNSESCFATVEAAGENRGRDLIEKALAHPVLDRGHALTEADALLVTLMGGPDMTIGEVNRVMDALRRQPEDAQFIMGASISEEFAGRLSLTVVAAKHAVQDVDQPNDKNSPGGGRPGDPQIETQFLQSPEPESLSASRFVPPPPELTESKKSELFARQGGRGGKMRKAGSRWRQGQLPLEIISKGRFEKSQPTIHHGEDLDVPTYIRRGIKLN